MALRIRQVVLVDQEVLSERGRQVEPPTRRVAACAVLENPFAGRRPPEDDSGDLEELVALSEQAGDLLANRALDALAPIEPRGYGKAALVGTEGDLEHGAGMIHVRLGLSMRTALRDGPALIPGNAKVGPAGTPIDVIFGGIADSWDYDAMDTMTITIPDAPRPNEILLAVAFLGGTRPNARVSGASPAVVEQLVARLRTEG
ncbi:amino acid synthesis family protein [Flindersiella endophytica]